MSLIIFALVLVLALEADWVITRLTPAPLATAPRADRGRLS
jgi:hypothetical protein